METIKVEQEMEETGPIIIQIQYDDSVTGQQTHRFVTHREDPLRRILLDFCDRVGLVYGSTRFCLDGGRIRETQTPHDLKMANDDLIDAFNDQAGAGHN